VNNKLIQENNLQLVNPVLAKEWHPNKNGALAPANFTPNSHAKVWWLCKNGHEWIAEIKARNQGNRCPHCSGRFFAIYKRGHKISNNLIREWHPAKNKPLVPEIVTAGSSKKVWWICSKGHEWQATVASRTRGRGCPHCFGKFASTTNCLEVVNPVLAKQWHPTKNGNLTPKDVKVGSQTKVWWICETGHEWLCPVRERSRGRNRCPYCHGKFLIRYEHGEKIENNLVKEWHPTKNIPLTPEMVAARSGRKIWWLCKRGHEWQATLAARSYGSGCPYCKPKTSSLELQIYSEMKYIFNNVEQRKKIDGVECDIFVPNIKVGIEVDGVYWHKNKYPSDKTKTLYFQDRNIFLIRLREKGLEKISENDIFFSSKDKIFDLIKKILSLILPNVTISNELRSRIDTYLRNSMVMNEKLFFNLLEMLPGPLPGFRLSDKNMKLAQEWHPTKNSNLTPNDVSFGSQTRVWWICHKGHEWIAPVSNRNSGAGCPYCEGKAVCADNSLQILHPLLAKEWHPRKNGDLTPSNVTANSGKKVWWLCTKGHEWQATINSRNKRKRGCPYCSGRLSSVDNCLLLAEPKIAQEWHPTKNAGLLPKDVTRRSNKTVWWLCSKGHEWQTTVHAKVGGQRCPYCYPRSAPLVIKCKVCGKDVHTWESEVREGKRFCSKKCFGIFLKAQPRKHSHIVKCEICGKEFGVAASQIKNGVKFCSRKCAVIGRKLKPSAKLKFVCKICGKEFFLYPSQAKRGTNLYCSRRCKSYDKNKIIKH